MKIYQQKTSIIRISVTRTFCHSSIFTVRQRVRIRQGWLRIEIIELAFSLALIIVIIFEKYFVSTKSSCFLSSNWHGQLDCCTPIVTCWSIEFRSGIQCVLFAWKLAPFWKIPGPREVFPPAPDGSWKYFWERKEIWNMKDLLDYLE